MHFCDTVKCMFSIWLLRSPLSFAFMQGKVGFQSLNTAFMQHMYVRKSCFLEKKKCTWVGLRMVQDLATAHTGSGQSKDHQPLTAPHPCLRVMHLVMFMWSIGRLECSGGSVRSCIKLSQWGKSCFHTKYLCHVFVVYFLPHDPIEGIVSHVPLIWPIWSMLLYINSLLILALVVGINVLPYRFCLLNGFMLIMSYAFCSLFFISDIQYCAACRLLQHVICLWCQSRMGGRWLL